MIPKYIFKGGREKVSTFFGFKAIRIIFVVILLLFCGLFWDYQENPDFLVQMEQANQARQKGDLVLQIEILKRALSERRSTLGEEHLGVARLSSRLVHVLAQSYSLKDDYLRTEDNHIYAMKILGQAINIFELRLGADHWETGKAISQKGHLISEYQISRNEPPTERAILLMSQGLTILQRNLGIDDPQVILLKSLLGGLYFQQGKYGDAEKNYKETLNWVEKNAGSDSARLAWHLTTLSDVIAVRGKYQEAYEYIDRAEKIYLDKSLVDSRDFAVLTYKKGVLMILMDDWGSAKIILRKASILSSRFFLEDRVILNSPAYDLGFVLAVIEKSPTERTLRKVVDYLGALDSRYSFVLKQPIRSRELSLEGILALKRKANSEFKRLEMMLDQ